MQYPQSLDARATPVSCAARWSLRTLGEFGLYSDAGTLVLGPGKALACLAYLHAAPRQTVLRDHLHHMLWSDVDESLARHTLRQTTYYLRQHLGDDAIVTQGGTIKLAATIESDRTAFLQAIETGDLESAVRAYNGDYFAGFVAPGALELEHWTESECQQLRLRFLRAAEQLARARLDEGQFREVRELAARMRHVEPLDETAWRLGIHAALSAGDRISALADSQQLLDLLAAEGHALEPATRALVKKVRADRQENGASAKNELVAELVGRETQFAQLVQAFRLTRRETVPPVVLTAPAGLGKTRLLRDFARYLAAEGNGALYVRAQPADRDLSWSYAADLVRQLAQMPGAVGVSPASAAILAALHPSVASQWPSVTPVPHSDDEALRGRIAAIEELLHVVCEERPVAVLLDDWHWADATSRDALRRIASHTEAMHTLFVVAQRPRMECSVPVPHSALVIEPLDQAQVAAFVESVAVLPTESWSADLVSHLSEASAGSPLLLLETLKLALDRGALRLSARCWSCAYPDALSALFAEGNALSRRIVALEPPLDRILLLLSCAATNVPAPILDIACAPDSHDALTAALEELERRGLVSKSERGWSTAHDAISDATTAAASPAMRSRAHVTLGRAFADAARRTYDFRSAARHLSSAGDDAALAPLAARYVQHQLAVSDRRPVNMMVGELIGSAISEPRASAIVRHLPLRLRYRHLRLPLVAASIVAISALVALAAYTTHVAEKVGVRIVNWRKDAATDWRAYTHDLSAADLAAGVLAVKGFRASAVSHLDRPRGVANPKDPTLFATTRTFPDSGGEEVVVVSTSTGVTSRRTHQKGDDVFGDWSPDGRYLVIQTDRWSARSMSDIAIIDASAPTAAPKRLTFEPKSRDTEPMWSPDGSRIAFLRNALMKDIPDADRSSICLVTVDGRHESCLPRSRLTPLEFAGWVSAVEVAGAFRDSTQASRVAIVNVETGAIREIAEGMITWGQADVTGWLTCYCRRSVAEPYQALLISTARPEEALRLEPGDPPPEVSLGHARGVRSYLTRIRIDPVAASYPNYGRHRLSVRGWNASASPMEPLALRWSSSDTSIASIDSTGLLEPRRGGVVRITVTSGGWVSDSVSVNLKGSQSSLLVDESWQHDFASTWAPFGDPMPLIEHSALINLLRLNGDSSFTSGVYFRRALPVAGGLGVEVELSMKITTRDWQTFDLMFVTSDSLDFTAWDHRTGHVPIPANFFWRGCSGHYPNSFHPDEIQMLDGLDNIGKLPRGVATGMWSRVRLQVFPDGRCGIAVNGHPVVVGQRRVAFGRDATLVMQGYSHRTNTLLGRVQVWRGVRRDVNWDATPTVPLAKWR